MTFSTTVFAAARSERPRPLPRAATKFWNTVPLALWYVPEPPRDSTSDGTASASEMLPRMRLLRPPLPLGSSGLAMPWIW